ncbi:hypothetical protein RND81_02G064600 [Saponaria officinalis]|uniref:F-box domain-containing protein n=1 Tax=Saponaria officinalis TaxID=3572 RepID=A0AAW1MJU7_SAPOF
MFRRNRTNVSDRRYLPPDLCIDNILPRLPVKTLFVCRAVCRTWRAVIDDPAFASKHFKLSTNNRDKKKVLAIEKIGLNGYDGCNLTLRRADTLRRCANIYKTYGTYRLSVRCNGLVFVKDNTTNLKVWNPSIRKSLTVPMCPLVTGHHIVNYLFGFRPSTNDYVIYAFSVEYDGKPVRSSTVAVYTMSDDRWRIKDNKMSLPSWLFKSSDEPMCDGKSVYLNGAVYWLRFDNNERDAHKRTCLISFDFNLGKFGFLGVPDYHPKFACTTYRILFAFNGTLALFCISLINNLIWVLKDRVWGLLFSGRSSAAGYSYIRDHLDVITKLFYFDADGITLVFGKVCYKLVTDEIKPITKSVNSRLILDTYLESMVLHRGCQNQILTHF